MKPTAIFIVNIILFITTLPLWAQNPDKLEKEIASIYPILEQHYVHLHQNPELSFREKNTSAYLLGQLKEWGYQTISGIGGNGFAAYIKNGNGPTIMIRADMDALPVKEETGLPYASTVTDTLNGKNVHVMHACGHDVHMTVLLGTANILQANKKSWNGTIIFIGQPAEERSGGANAMLEDGLFDKVGIPNYILSLHASATLPSGTLGIRPGNAMASVDMVDITVYGRGGHGAYPHTTIDPIVLSSRLILDFQTIVSRELSPLEPAVVTVGSIHGGTKGNIIPEEVKMELTLRSYSDKVRQQQIDAIKRICNNVAASTGLTEPYWPKIEIRNEYTPFLFNDPGLSTRLLKIFKEHFGNENAIEVEPVMAGEDFSRYGRTKEEIPICLFWLGTVPKTKYQESLSNNTVLPSLHSSKFAPEMQTSIITGVTAMTIASLNLLR